MSRRVVLFGAGMALWLSLLGCAAPVTSTPKPLPSLTPQQQTPGVLASPTAAGAVQASPTIIVVTATPGGATPVVVVTPTALSGGGGPGAVRTTMTPGATPCTETPGN